MKEVTKQEINQAFLQHSLMFGYMIYHPNEKIGDILVSINDKKDITKYKNIYIAMECIRYLANIDPNYFKTIKNTDIAEEEWKRDLFKTPAESKKFSWKQILKNIQKTYHEYNSKDIYYKIYEEGEVLEFHLEEAKPIPFHITIEKNLLLKIIGRILHTEYYYTYNSIQWDTKEFHLICLKDKWNISLENAYIKLRVENKTYQEQDKEFLMNLMKLKTSYEIKKYKLLPEQIEAYQTLLNREDKTYIDKMILKMFINYYSSCIMPIASIKTFLNIEEINLVYAFYDNLEKTFQEFMEEYQAIFRSFLHKEDKTKFGQEQYMFYIEDPFRVITNVKPMIYQKYYQAIIEMAQYYLSNIYKKEIFEIGEKKYKKKDIIKAFQKEEWYINPNKKPIIRIIESKKKKDKIEFIEKDEIDLEALMNWVVTNSIKEKIK